VSNRHQCRDQKVSADKEAGSVLRVTVDNLRVACQP
jgi:hypothetical protein